MMTKSQPVLNLLFAMMIVGSGHALRCESHSAKRVYVPDEATAVRIAEAVFIPIYGEHRVKTEEPFHARLHDTFWIVSGTLKKPRKKGLIVMGGSMTAEIDQTTGCIKDVYHGK